MARILLLLIVSCLTFANSLRNDFALDDLLHIKDNKAIQSLNVVELFTSPIYPGNLYRPLPMLSYAATHSLYGLNPMPYHLTNVVLNALVVIAAFLLLRPLINEQLAIFTALLFAVHPLHVEAVANVSGRPELMAAFFSLLALLCSLAYCRDEKRLGMLGLLFIFCLCALFSKESAVVLPGLILLCSCTHLGVREGTKRSLRPLLVSLLSISTYFYFRSIALGSLIPGSNPVPPIDNPLMLIPVGGERFLNALRLLGAYVRLSIIPAPLKADYSLAEIVPIESLFSPQVMKDLAALLLIVAVFSVGVIKQNKALLFFTLWFITAFAVTSNLLFPIGTAFAERLAYLPSLGTIGLMAYCCRSFTQKSAQLASLSILMCAFAITSYFNNMRWVDNLRLFEHDILLNSKSARSHFNFGIAMRIQGDFERSALHLSKAREIYPEDPEIPFALGVTELMRGNETNARNFFESALLIKPNHVRASVQLGALNLKAGKYESAEKLFQRASAIDPGNFSAILGMLAVKIELRDFSSAAELSSRAAAINPEDAQLIRLQERLAKLQNGTE